MITSGIRAVPPGSSKYASSHLVFPISRSQRYDIRSTTDIIGKTELQMVPRAADRLST